MLADLGLLYCAVFWGMSFVTMKILVSVYPTCWLLFLRFLAGGVMLYLFFSKRIKKNFSDSLKAGIILGVLLFAALGTQTVGLNYIGGGRSAFISAIYVLMVPLMLWAARKIFPGWVSLGGACLCVAGMYLLTGDEISGTFNFGDFLTVVCAFIFALQVILIGKYTKGCDPLTLSFVEFISLAACALIFSLLFETRPVLIDQPSLPELIFTTVLCTFGCYMIQIVAQAHVKPSRATIIMSLESVFGLLSSVIFLDEPVSLRSGLGCALILAAVLIVELEPYFLMHKLSQRS